MLGISRTAPSQVSVCKNYISAVFSSEVSPCVASPALTISLHVPRSTWPVASCTPASCACCSLLALHLSKYPPLTSPPFFSVSSPTPTSSLVSHFPTLSFQLRLPGTVAGAIDSTVPDPFRSLHRPCPLIILVTGHIWRR